VPPSSISIRIFMSLYPTDSRHQVLGTCFNLARGNASAEGYAGTLELTVSTFMALLNCLAFSKSIGSVNSLI